MKLTKILGMVGYIACCLVGNYKFGWPGGLLCIAAWMSACLFFTRQAHTTEEESEHDSCDGCRYDLGGGCCKINVEGECREGGGFELWEPDVGNPPKGSDAEDA